MYYTPHSITNGESTFNATDNDVLSQVKHHFRSIRPVTIIKVRKVYSQPCSKCIFSPYDKPQESPDYRGIVSVKTNSPPDSQFDLSSRFDESGLEISANKSSDDLSSSAGAEIGLLEPTQQVCWKCHESRNIRVSKHVHRMGVQGIVYRGPEITAEKPIQLLWQV